MSMTTLKDLYIEQLRDLYSAETQLIEALPKMAAAAHSMDLKTAFTDHLGETKEHKRRLERIFTTLGVSPQGETCAAMKGLVIEGEKTIQKHGDPDVKDAALIAAAQRVEHYEMAGYGTVRSFAKHLEYDDAVALLSDTLEEEGKADKLLNSIAEGGWFVEGVNVTAPAR